jgi:phage tail sheath protein FI
MPVTPTYPGVYVQEIPSGVRTIVGVSTSIGMFIGTSKKGPLGKPIRCTSYLDFTRSFSDDPTGGGLAEYVKLFFLNGGTDCYVMRIANGATQSVVTLLNENTPPDPVLELKAKDFGLAGESIRAVVTYNGPQPEATFNLELFRWEIDTTGRRVKQDTEVWQNLSMDPASPLYAPDFLTQTSKLVNAKDMAPAIILPGFSLSGRLVPSPNFQTAWTPLLTPTKHFQISVNGSPYVEVVLTAIAVTTPVATGTAIANAIHDTFNAKGIPGITVTVTFPNPQGNLRRMRIEPATGHGDVFIRPGSQNDLAVPLMLGTAQGGLEVSAAARALRRPAPNGITFRAIDPAAYDALAVMQQTAVPQITLDDLSVSGIFPAHQVDLIPPAPPPSVITSPGNRVFVDNIAGSPNGHSDGVREKFAIIAQRVNDTAAAFPATFKWRAEVWGSRLALIPNGIGDNFVSPNFPNSPAALVGLFTNNVQYYSLGRDGLSLGRQTSAGGPASDGTVPQATDYDAAYLAIDKEVDLFNLMILPPDDNVPVTSLYGLASVFCQKRRAFLIMDPPASPSAWTSAQQAATGVAALRVGLVKDYSAIFFPRITIDRQGKQVNVGPAGAIAGLVARIDGTRGVWKAPAGTEADLRGVIGLEYRLSDGENGVTNPRAVNTLRIFPNGIVAWGARTNDGDDDFASEYKYIPIRRLALYIEESLYRGLKWVVFEPNDEPLWAQIRLNVGAFMHNLFRQGAFQGQTPREAYFVKCDKETTTQNDRNLGIVNIMVGFAPLKPAEFVILYLQQMAGQIQV